MKFAKHALSMAALVALVACGGAADADAGAMETEVTGAAAGATPAAKESAASIVPAEFQGEWDMNAKDSCIASDKRITITGDSIRHWGGEPSKIVKATLVGEGDLKLVGATDPDHPDADQSFGLYLSDNGNALALGAPNMTGLNLVRCEIGKRALASAKGSTQPPARGRLPAAMLGQWDMADANDGFECSSNSGNRMWVEADKLRFPSGYSTLTRIERVSDRKYRMIGQYHEGGEPKFIPNAMMLTLSPDGGTLSLTVEGFDDDTVYDVKC